MRSSTSSTSSEQPYLEQLERGHPLLRFAGPLEAEFRAHYRRASRPRIRTGLIAAVVLALLSLALMLGVFRPPPEVQRAFALVVLGILLPLALAALALLQVDRHMRWLPHALIAGVLASTAALVVLRVAFERSGQHYPYTIENYICVLIFLLSGWRFFVAMAVALAALVVVVAADVALRVGLPGIAEHVFNLVATGTFASAGCYLTEHISRTQFLQRHVVRFRATRDALTGLHNRRSFDEQLARLWREARREGRSVGVMVADVDHFKQYNDSWGHAAGDAALQAVARALAAQAGRRPLDLAARLGGEEFVAVWFGAGLDDARALAERVRSAIEALGLAQGAPGAGVLTISAGCAAACPQDDDRAPGLLAAADAALYAAKRAGRNRVLCAAQDADFPGRSAVTLPSTFMT